MRADPMDSHATRSADFVCGHSLPLDFVWFELTGPSEFVWLEPTGPLEFVWLESAEPEDFVLLRSIDDVERRLVGTPSSESACNECPQMEATSESAEPRASGVDSQFNQAPKKSAPAGTFARADSMDSLATRSADFVCGHSLLVDFVLSELTPKSTKHRRSRAQRRPLR